MAIRSLHSAAGKWKIWLNPTNFGGLERFGTGLRYSWMVEVVPTFRQLAIFAGSGAGSWKGPA